MDSIYRAMADKGFYREDSGRWVAGVCAGIARQTGVDVGAVRALTVLLFLLGAPLVAYVVLWIVMPDEGTARRLTTSTVPGALSGQRGSDYPQDDVPGR